LNAKIKRMSRRRAKKAVVKKYVATIHMILNKACASYVGEKLDSKTIAGLKNAINNKLAEYMHGGLISIDPSSDEDRLVIHYPSALEKFNFDKTSELLEVQP
jgi:hypothetical protein